MSKNNNKSLVLEVSWRGKKISYCPGRIFAITKIGFCEKELEKELSFLFQDYDNGYVNKVFPVGSRRSLYEIKVDNKDTFDLLEDLEESNIFRLVELDIRSHESIYQNKQ